MIVFICYKHCRVSPITLRYLVLGRKKYKRNNYAYFVEKPYLTIIISNNRYLKTKKYFNKYLYFGVL